MKDNDKKPPLLSDSLKKASIIAWTLIVPQTLLLILNIRGWLLVGEEMSPRQIGKAYTIFGYELALLFCGIGLLLALWRMKRHVGLPECIGMIILHVGYLWMITAWLDNLLPDSVTLWILPQSQFIYYQYALMMPALFYSGLRISCFRLSIHTAADIGISLATLILVPIGWFLVLQVLSSLFRHMEPPFIITLIFLVGSTLIVLMAFLRLLLFLYGGLRKLRAGWFILPLFAGILAPLGGLILNRNIPFPYDFQDPMGYALAVLNGLILLIPFKTGSRLGITGWMLRSVMYTFTLYFFIVFLPFMPLSLLAMIAMGAGFLILAPTLLFVVHTRQLYEEGRQVAARLGVTRTIALFVVCVSLIPIGYTVRALCDKAALMSAVDAVYSPDYDQNRINIRRSSVRRSLHRLQTMKAGSFVPFLSDIYNSLVFDGMVLPDYKVKKVYQVLFGDEEIPKMIEGMGWNIFGPRARRAGRGGRNVRLPDRNVSLLNIDVTEEKDTEVVNAVLKFTMKNNGRAASEFVTDIQIPDGVLVTAYWLNVGQDRVPGRIFERKSAMWVYHMIRDTTRRDPGLLVYKTHSRMRLSVFPFAEDQTRTTEIQLSFPAGLRPEIGVGERSVKLGVEQGAEAERIIKTTDAKRSWLLVSPSAAGNLPATQRKPYIHFVIDRSVAAEEVFATFIGDVDKVLEAMPHVRMCRITLANYEYDHVTERPVSVTDVSEILSRDLEQPPFRGGLSLDRVIKSTLLEFKKSPPTGEEGQPMVPIFVVIAARQTVIIPCEDLASFADIVPDSDAYYQYRSNGGCEAVSLVDGKKSSVSKPHAPGGVVLFRAGNRLAACSASRGGLVHLPTKKGTEVEIYDASAGEFVALPESLELLARSTYYKGLVLWAESKETDFEPAQINNVLPSIVKGSRDTGVLVPLTSYIVVENSAQWKMLKLAEKKALKADHALEFDEFQESPAPSILFLVPALVFLLCRRKKES